MGITVVAGVAAMAAGEAAVGQAAFGPENPFYAASTLPYQAPPFDKIKDTRLPAGARGRDGRAVEGGRGDRQQPGAADLREHAGGAGEERRSSTTAWRRSSTA